MAEYCWDINSAMFSIWRNFFAIDVLLELKLNDKGNEKANEAGN